MSDLTCICVSIGGVGWGTTKPNSICRVKAAVLVIHKSTISTSLFSSSSRHVRTSMTVGSVAEVNFHIMEK